MSSDRQTSDNQRKSLSSVGCNAVVVGGDLSIQICDGAEFRGSALAALCASGRSLRTAGDDYAELVAGLDRALGGSSTEAVLSIPGLSMRGECSPIREVSGAINRAIYVASAAGRATKPVGRKILVVDNDVSHRNLMVASLTMSGVDGCPVEVRVANDGVEALQQLGSFQPDAIVLELLLPVMDGMALLRTLRADQRYHSIRVAVVTSKRSTAAEERMIRRESSVFIEKGPGIEARLLRALKEIHNSGVGAASA